MAIHIDRKPKLKRITIRISALGQIAISAPRGVSTRELDRALERRRGWIDRKLIDQKRYIHLIEPTLSVLYRGYLYNIEWRSAEERSIAFEEGNPGTIRIATREGRPDSNVLRGALKSESEAIKKIAYVSAENLGVAITRVTIRNQATRWGSSSSIGTISLNWRLIMAPDEVMRYLVIHELAHQRYMNHSKSFWNQVLSWCPEYREHDSWLKEHSFLLSLLR